MSRERAFSPRIFSGAMTVFFLAAIGLLCGLRNLPWHLDDKDQAKQAFVSYQMIGEGKWWFQHTPAGRVATKPPLAGWVSAGLYVLTGRQCWEIAWRMPGLVCAGLMLWLLWKAGEELGGPGVGGFLATVPFGLHHFTPRLATLVRTDMMLSFFIFLAGFLVLQKVRAGVPWTTGERWQLFTVILASMLTKGPIAYAFLLPGLAAYGWLARRERLPNHAWAGWWCWFGPLLLFGLWAGVGIATSREFFQDVVQHEFMGRFTVGAGARHHNQPIYFYVAQVLGKWAPWSLLLVALLFRRDVRAALWRERDRRWIACWALGGLLFMSFVPSKRSDRIHPVIPPLCLCLAAAAGPALSTRLGRIPVRLAVRAACGLALLGHGAVAAAEIGLGYATEQGALVNFGEKVCAAAAADPARLAVVGGKDEGMLLYTGAARFVNLDDALAAWQQERLDWLVVSEHHFRNAAPQLAPFKVLAVVPRLPEKQSGYWLLARRPSPANHLP